MGRREIGTHALPIDEVFQRLDSGPHGLTRTDAERRLARVGRNRLEVARGDTALTLFLRQFKSVVVVLLLVAAVIASVTGAVLDAAAIAVVLLLNAALGFATEYRASRAIAALLDLDVPHATVMRDGEVVTIDAQTLVPGDHIVLNRGQHVPADGRVVEASDLRIDEAPLTGESFPVSKLASVLPPDTPLAERRNMVYKGTLVAAGTARVAVTDTGMRTEVGRIGALTTAVHTARTPLERRLDALGNRLVWLALAVGGLVALVGRLHGAPLAQVIETGIALAVAAVPEALPAVATISLAVGVKRMAARHALVRRLAAAETLGSTTTICTDKTRTLTSGVMSVGRVWTGEREFVVRRGEGGGTPDPRLVTALEVAVLASQPQSSHGQPDASANADPVDAAVLQAAADHGIDRRALEQDRPSVGLVPFSSERRFTASFHRVGASTIAYVKGAPHAVLALTGETDGSLAMAEEDRTKLERVNERLAAEGFRVLALAYGAVASVDEASLQDLTSLGLIGLIDPPAAGVAATVARLQRAGLRIVMLTGDQRLTAEAVGRDIGLFTGDAQMAGPGEIDDMSPQHLRQVVTRIAGFSRVTAEQKLDIVRALQARGEIVAMIGDGINDAAALKQADVGVAMGRRGSDAAKQTASIVLQDDRFETIAAAVEEGRVIFDNVRKVVFYLFSCNVGEVLVLLGAGLAGLPQPLSPLQILWMNLVTDTFPALALAAEAGESDVMARPPRDPHEAILSATFLRSIAAYGILITVVTLAAFVWALRARPDHAVSIAFTTLALAQIFHLGNARSSHPVLTLQRASANRQALAAVALTVALQLAALYIPALAATLSLTPLSWMDWLVVVPLSLLPALAGQATKLLRERRESQ
ncbi:MAG: cation-transporting P-type ATPase [Acidobacteriota bacterium]